MRYLLFVVVAVACHAAPLWNYTTYGYWGATLPNSGQGFCWAVAYQAEMPTADHCRIEVTDRSMEPGSVIAPETVTEITGTLLNTSDATMYAVWFDNGTLTLGPHESYTGMIGTIYGRWTPYFQAGGGIYKDVGWLNFSEIPGGAYMESVGIYTYDEARSFVYETPEPGTLTLCAIALALYVRAFARERAGRCGWSRRVRSQAR